MRKWRPPLWLVLGGALAATLAFALAGLVALRYLGPEIGTGIGVLALVVLLILKLRARRNQPPHTDSIMFDKE